FCMATRPTALYTLSLHDALPISPDGAEAIVSAAFAGLVHGRGRGALLAELVSLRPSIVVAGAHGKTTTAAMIAFCLERLGLDPTDRKSTRLNSSHDQISYAVFCL